MGYFNPMLAYGLPKLAADAAAVGISGFIVPDLPIEESAAFEQALARPGPRADPHGHAGDAAGAARAAVQERAGLRVRRVDDRHHRPFRRHGAGVPQETLDYLDKVRKLSPVSGVRGLRHPRAAQVAALAPHVDGVVVASATIEAMERGESAVALLRKLRG